MVRIKNGCRELTVSDNIVDSYLNAGWQVINDRGDVIEYEKPMSYDAAVKRVAQLEAYMKGLRESLDASAAKIKALEAENRKLRRAAKKEG